MTEMADHERPVQLPDVPEGEEISAADAVERTDQDPEEQENRVDPVWSENAADETEGDQGHEPRHAAPGDDRPDA
jgi:hypothetical protein